MTTVNPYFTMNYAQPGEYNFSHDSVFLARLAFDYVLKNQIDVQNVLDLCSGCGVVGLDFLFHLKTNSWATPSLIDFLEIQSVYLPFFSTNCQTLEKSIDIKLSLNFLNMNYADVYKNLDLAKKYDFVLCNPPFFRNGQGTLSPSDFKNRCRFFMDSDFENLINSVSYLLAPGGRALILIKTLKDHGVDVIRDLESSANGLTVQKINTLRGIELFELAKPLV